MRLTVFSKLFLAFLMMTLLLAAFGLTALTDNRAVVGAFTKGERYYRDIITAATEVSSFSKRAEGHLFMYLSLHEGADKEKFLARCASLQEQLVLLDTTIHGSDAREKFEELKRLANNILPIGRSLIDAHDRDMARVGKFNNERYAPLLKKMFAATSKVRELSVDLAKHEIALEADIKQSAVEEAESLQVKLIWLALISSITALLVSYVISRSISRPFGELKTMAAEIGGGNFKARANITSEDEIGALAVSLNRMAENLHEYELQLRLSEQTYRGILDSITEAVYIEDANGRFLDVNRAAEEMYGYAKEEFAGRTLEFLAAPDSTDLPVEKTLRGQPQSFEFWGLRKDGTIFAQDVSNSLGYYFGKKVNIAVARDITERRHMERELRENAARFRNIVENLQQAYYEADARSLLTYGNPGIFLVSGYSEQELIGVSSFRFVAKEHRARVIEAFKEWMREKRKDMFLEFLVQKKNGEKLWVEQTTHFEFDEQGRFIKATNILKNIHERKLAEEKIRDGEITLRGIIDSIHEALYIQDGDGRFLDVNLGAEKLYGYERSEFIGRTAEFLAAPGKNDLAKLGEFIRRTYNGTAQSFEFWGKAKNGRIYLKEVHLYPGIYFGRKCIIAIAHDITERKATEQLLRDMQRRESIGILAGGIAHDFNNLLGAMMGNVSLAQSQLPAHHPAVKNIEKALTAMERAAGLTRQMLAYSGKGQFQIRAVNVAEVVEEHMSLFEVSLPKNVKLETHLPQHAVYVNGDPAQIEQVIMNLIINGGDAIGDGQGAVSVRLSEAVIGGDELLQYGLSTNTTLTEGSYAVLEVSDNGAGMSRETMAKIFDPFFTTKFIGRGLGLSAVLGIVQGHKGGITVESTEGAGTTFRLILPAAASPVSDREPKENENTNPC